jgi:hypothetical protein
MITKTMRVESYRFSGLHNITYQTQYPGGSLVRLAWGALPYCAAGVLQLV